MKNPTLISDDREKVIKKGKRYKCTFCEKEYDNHQALGGHQRKHQHLIKQLIQQKILAVSHKNSTDISQYNPEQGNALKKLPAGNYHVNSARGEANPLFKSPIFPSAGNSNASINHNPMVPLYNNSVNNVTNSNLKYGINNQMINFHNGPKNNPFAFTGGYYDYYYTQGGNNSSLVPLLQSNGTMMPSAMLMDHQFHLSCSSNPIVSASNADKSQSSNKGYVMNDFSQPMGPYFPPRVGMNQFNFMDEPNTSKVLPLAQTQLVGPPNYKDYNSVSKAQNRGEVEEHFFMIGSLKGLSNNGKMKQDNKGLDISTKDAETENAATKDSTIIEDGHVILFGDLSTGASVKENTDSAKEENGVDLDLSLHL